MPVKPPSQLFRVDYIDVIKVERDMTPEQPPQIRTVEVIKEVEKVVYKDDPSLLSRLNEVLKQNGELKAALNAAPGVVRPEINTIYSTVEKIIEKPVRDLRSMLIVGTTSTIGGMILCWLILR